MIAKKQVSLFALLVGITSLLAVPQLADATAGRCSGGSCIFVKGNKLNVEYVKGGLTLSNGAKTFGHVEIWGDGFRYNSPDRHFSNPFRPGGAITRSFTAAQLNLNRDLPNRSKVCSRFWVKTRRGYQGREIVCVTIRG